MTINTTTRKAGPYAGDNVTVAFPFAYKVFSASDLYVVRTDAIGNETVLTLTTQYTVALNANQNANPGGTVTLLAALATGTTLTLSSSLANLQQTDLTNQGGFFPDVVTDALDKLTILIQQASDAVSRSLKTSISTPAGVNPTLPAPAPYKVFGWDGTGTGIVNTDPSGTSALASDLAAPSGSSLVRNIGTGTGEVATTLAINLNLKVKGLKKNFGAVGDGVANDYTAINNAFQASGKIIEIEDGTFLYNTALTPPICSEIVGFGMNASILKPGSTVVKGLSITGANAPSILRGFALSGNAVASARGLILGDGSLTNGQLLESLYVHGFTGTGAVGLDVRDMVSASINQCLFSANTQNIRLNTQAVGGTPTTIAFNGGTCQQATNEGAVILSGYGISFNEEFIFQTNGKEGLKVVPVGAVVSGLALNDTWFEGNWGSNTAQYQLVIDGSDAGCTVVQPAINRGYFSGSGLTAKSVHMTGTNLRGGIINSPIVPNLAGQILIDSNAQINIPDWSSNSTLATVLTNTSVNGPTANMTWPAVQNALSPWTSWVPVFTSSAGDTATTFTGTPTTTLARYRVVGKTINIIINWLGTLKAVTPGYILISMPTGYNTRGTDQFATYFYSLAAGYGVGTIRSGSDSGAWQSQILMYNSNFTNWTSGALVGGYISATFELA